MKITDTQHEVLTEIARCQSLRRPISIGDLCRGFGWRDYKSAREHVDRLEKMDLASRNRNTGELSATGRGLLLLDVEASAA